MTQATEALDTGELLALIERVFAPAAHERSLAVLVDLPTIAAEDTPRWAARRAIAAQWCQQLGAVGGTAALRVGLFSYPNVGVNNAELPGLLWPAAGAGLAAAAEHLEPSEGCSLGEVLADYALVVALTELSATAPLKLLAPRYGFRAATMPGFCAEMVPALRLDYREVDRRVRVLKGLLDEAGRAELSFLDRTRAATLHLTLDLRHRKAHASGGLLPTPGSAGNLPSGEAYIVPYEGELNGDPSRSRGTLPVELDSEVVHYQIEGNRACAIGSEGPVARRERELLVREPAYGNIAELGLGVLADFGLAPIGQILLDEKLGLHLAFGRSDHFGGRVAPADFSAPEAVVHIDRVYLPATQPQVAVLELALHERPGGPLVVMRDGRYVLTL